MREFIKDRIQSNSCYLTLQKIYNVHSREIYEEIRIIIRELMNSSMNTQRADKGT